MNPLHIYRPTFDKPYPKTKEEYSHQMQHHLQDMEDWQRTMHEEETEGWGIGQMWVMEHNDGRIANLPDQCHTNKSESGPKNDRRFTKAQQWEEE